MNAQVATLPAVNQPRSVLMSMAGKYNMEPAAFEATLRGTVFPSAGTREQFAAFLLVANEYGLNPVTKEIYAFPAKGGGIVPIVSIDGWFNIINSHPAFNGIEFDDRIEDSKVTSITCRIWRKDRDKPIVVTEYLAECFRPTEPWQKYPRRMLRHKAAIQCARYAFGFAGIVDPDEAERMDADVSPMRTINHDEARPTPPPIPPAEPAQARVVDHDPQTGEIWDDGAPPVGDPLDIPADLDRRTKPVEPPTEISRADGEWLRELEGALSGCEDMVGLGETQSKMMVGMRSKVTPAAWKQAAKLVQDTVMRLNQTILDAG